MFADADEMIEQGKFQHRMLHRSNAERAVMTTSGVEVVSASARAPLPRRPARRRRHG